MEEYFSYVPVDSSKREFRLIELLPSDDISAPACCELIYDNLDSQPVYEALSYVWGDSRETSRIFLNGQSFPVTTNLATALRHLRQRQPRILWIDAICINQKSLSERAEQVCLMGYIYRCAVADVFWLGNDTGFREDHLQLLKEDFRVTDLKNLSKPGDLSISASVQRLIKIFGDEELRDRFWKDAEPLFTAAGWSRVWILQEVFLAKEISVLYGQHIFKWETLYVILTIYNKYGENGYMHMLQPQDWEETDHYKKPSILWARDSCDKSQSLIRLLDSTNSFGVTDQRDRIFGTLGMAEETFGIVPDYTQDVTDVYLDATRKIIAQSKSLDIFMLGTMCVGDKRTLPSWVPRLDSGKLSHACFTVWTKFSSGLSKTINLHTDRPEQSRNPKVLRLRGIIVDKIQTIGKPSIRHWGNPFEYTRFFKDYITSRTPNTKYFNGEDLLDSYIRCILRDSSQYDRTSNSKDRSPPFFKIISSLYTRLKGQEDIMPEDFDFWEDKDFMRFLALASLNGLGDKIALTDKMYLATVLNNVQDGDLVCVFYGCPSPMMLRPAVCGGHEGYYVLLGPVYVQGFMNGEIFKMHAEGKVQSRDLEIV